MSQALLSMVMNGKRPLTAKQAMQVSVLLGLDRAQAEQLLEWTLLALPANAKRTGRVESARARRAERVAQALFEDLGLEKFRVISQWHHVAILDLSTTRGFRDDPNWIAQRLGIETGEARTAIERLESLGLLTLQRGVLRKSREKVFFPTSRSAPEIRSFHQQMIERAREELQRTKEADFEARSISGMTMAIRLDRLDEAKRRIQNFQKEMAHFLTEGEREEVYQLNVQFFPLTKTAKESRNEKNS